MLNTVIVPGILAKAMTAPLAPGDVDLLDRMVAKAARQALRLPRSYSTAMVRLDADDGGLGVPSIYARYTAENAASVLEALRDSGSLARVTRALLHLQQQRLRERPGECATPHVVWSCTAPSVLAHPRAEVLQRP
jgi:hypothetical protein